MFLHLGEVISSSNTHFSAQVSECLADILSWMPVHQIKFNPCKTKLFFPQLIFMSLFCDFPEQLSFTTLV